MSEATPMVLLVDDEDQTVAATALESLGVQAQWRYPSDVEPGDLATATLLAVDEVLNLQEKPPPDDDIPAMPRGAPMICYPPDGLSLSAVLRSAAATAVRSHPLGITLRTGALDSVTAHLPHEVRRPWLAAEYNLEWVVSKPDVDAPRQSDLEIVSLARAIASYPTAWGEVVPTGTKWVGVPDAPWRDRAASHIEQCRPPRDLEAVKRGLSWVRWLAHRALVYPSFVLSPLRAAVMLGVTLPSFTAVVERGDSDFANAVLAAQYAGQLADLAPPRLWRAAIAQIAEDTAGPVHADDPVEVGERLAKLVPGLEPLGLDVPVVCVDGDYAETGDVAEQADCQMLSPDGWPAYADQAWARSSSLTAATRAMCAPRLV